MHLSRLEDLDRHSLGRGGEGMSQIVTLQQYLIIPVAEAGHVLAHGEDLAGEVGLVVEDSLSAWADAH